MKLLIRNYLEDEIFEEVYDPELKSYVKKRRIEQYDEEKWKDGSVYEFNTLKEMGEFIDSCDIDFTEEYARKNFTDWSYEYIDTENYYIDQSEDNLMILCISSSIEISG